MRKLLLAVAWMWLGLVYGQGRPTQRVTSLAFALCKERRQRHWRYSLRPKSCQMAESHHHGSITARILPSTKLNYNDQKPKLRCDSQPLMEKVVEKLRHLSCQTTTTNGRLMEEEDEDDDDDGGGVVYLHAEFQLPDDQGVTKHSDLFMKRNAYEELSRTLARLQLSIAKKLDLQSADRTRPFSNPKPLVRINSGGTTAATIAESSENLISKDFWVGMTGKEASLCVKVSNDTELELKVTACPPTILEVRTFEEFEALIFVGVPITVEPVVLHGCRTAVFWFLDGEPASVDNDDTTTYTPTKDDVGKTVSVLLVPIGPHVPARGQEEAYRFRNAVQEMPHMPIVHEVRHNWIQQRPQATKDVVRVMTYNLLADLYTTRDGEISPRLSYCPPFALDRKRRMPLLLHEILSYQPDLVCLQEVDASVFESLFKPALESRGYQGYHSAKSSLNQEEGCAMFWLRNRFTEVDRQAVPLNAVLGAASHPWDGPWGESMDRVQHLLKERPHVKALLDGLTQVLQVTTLQTNDEGKEPTRIVVGNTHLYFHPRADHIRALQTVAVCRAMDSVRKGAPIILAGDLNSDPASGALQLLLKKQTDREDNETWKYLDVHLPKDWRTIGVLQLGLPPPTLTLSPTFPGLVAGCHPEFTHHVPGFVETLDYLLVSTPGDSSPGFVPLRAAPMPSKAVAVSTMVGIPSEGIPSDHVSVVVDFELSR